MCWPPEVELFARGGRAAAHVGIPPPHLQLVDWFCVAGAEGAVVIIGMKDPNFALIVGKPDNVPITAMLFVSTFVLWLALTQGVNNDRRAEQKLPPDEKESSNQKTWSGPTCFTSNSSR